VDDFLDPTPEELAAAQVAALRRQRIGSALQATGDRVLAPMGASQLQNASAAEKLRAVLAGRRNSHYQKTPEELAALTALAAEREARAAKMGRPADPQALEIARLRAEGVRLRNETARRKLEHSETNEGKALPPTQLNELAQFDTAEQQVDQLFNDFETSGGSGLGAKANRMATEALGLQDTDAAEYEAGAAPVRQGVGTILEGGKLAAGDEAKYKNMMPRYGDSPEVAAKKKAGLLNYLRSLKAEKQKALSSGGYKTPGATAPAPARAVPTTGEGAHVMKKQYSRSQNKTRIIYSDGRTEVVDGQP
jgi:hypothetical protein